MSKHYKPALKLAAIAAVLYSGATLAQSGVTLYGQADMFVGGIKNPGTGERAFVANSGGMQTSYWGIKGSEDLGAGTRAIFDLNAFYRTDNGRVGRFDGDSMFSRNAFVGLENSNYGSLKLGRNTTPYFVSTIIFNPLIDSYVFSPMVFHTYLTAANGTVFDPGIIGDSGWNNSLLYSTPTWGGLTANFIYGLGENAGNYSQNKWGGNVTYFNGNFGATLAFQQVKFDNAPFDVTNSTNPLLTGVSKQTAVQGGISYDFTIVKLFAQAQYIKTSISAANPNGDIKHTNGQVGASVPVGAGAVLATYAYGKTENAVSDFKRNTFALAYDYNLSKRTDVYAAYYYDKITGIEHGDSFGVGIRHKF
ncbi:porin [Cupriavidus plantarum]|uniref:porin n=1 Tax=Cupriavidus plantarum TaxID=942865 RepID=UPI0015C74C6E|nr:porin [Cupriavidus plantarum]NYH98302.1 putative porin [Cupriavidus plantarum]